MVSAVAYDARNERLINCLRTTGLDDFREWGSLFRGKSAFKTFTHQEWFQWVKDNHKGKWEGWIDYVDRRYKFSE